MPKKSTVSKAKYDAANSVRITMKLNRRTDAPILARLKAVPSMSGYIRQLILADIELNAPHLLDAEPLGKSTDGKQSLHKPTPKKGEEFRAE